jgi:hypothetical protein
MKLFLALNIALLFGSISILAMENLAKKELKEVAHRIRQIEFAHEQGAVFFMGGGQTQGDFIDDQFRIIEQIFNKNNISHPCKKTWKWLGDVKSEVQQALLRFKTISQDPLVVQGAAKVSENQDECDITGLDKVEVLLALWNAASANNYWHTASSFTREMASKVLRENPSIDYLGGKPLKVNLSGNAFNAYLYNRDNGAGLAQSVIAGLKKQP